MELEPQTRHQLENVLILVEVFIQDYVETEF